MKINTYQAMMDDNKIYPNEVGEFYKSSEKVRCPHCRKVVTGWNLAHHKKTKRCLAIQEQQEAEKSEDVQCPCERKEEFRGIVFCIDCGLESNEITFDNKSFHVLRLDKNKSKKVTQSTIQTAISTYTNDERVSRMCAELYDKYRQGKSNCGRFSKLLLYACKKYAHKILNLKFDEEEEIEKFQINKAKKSIINKIYNTRYRRFGYKARQKNHI